MFTRRGRAGASGCWCTSNSQGWESREHCLRYPGGAIQHAGVVVAIGDCAGHPGRFLFASELWPWLTLTREVSAVTGACMAVRADVFRQLGGFDAGFPVNYNDVDLCLRAGAAGYRAV